MSVLRVVLGFVLELVGLGVDAARDNADERKAERRSDARDRDLLSRFDANYMCACGHALSEHVPRGACRRCGCNDPHP